MLLKQWSFGDKVVHLDRPEWGVGVVSGAQADRHEGKDCQRLTIRFDRAGIKTLSSALANLVPAADAPAIHAEAPANEDPLLTGHQPSAKEVMLRLPEPATDPFSTPKARLAASAALYRYNEHGGSLLDWAATQSGLKDPMTRFSRHELEDLFKRWVMFRDEQLKKAYFDARKNDPACIAGVINAAPRAAQQVLRRLDSRR